MMPTTGETCNESVWKVGTSRVENTALNEPSCFSSSRVPRKERRGPKLSMVAAGRTSSQKSTGVAHRIGVLPDEGSCRSQGREQESYERPLTQALWELVRANVAKAEFIEAPISQLMQPVYHMIMATLKVLIDSVCLLYGQFEGGPQVIPTRSVRGR